jgi:hypothetical protein
VAAGITIRVTDPTREAVLANCRRVGLTVGEVLSLWLRQKNRDLPPVVSGLGHAEDGRFRPGGQAPRRAWRIACPLDVEVAARAELLKAKRGAQGEALGLALAALASSIVGVEIVVQEPVQEPPQESSQLPMFAECAA